MVLERERECKMNPVLSKKKNRFLYNTRHERQTYNAYCYG